MRTTPSLADAFPYPAADGSIQQNVATARATARACAKIGNELQYFTTANTARDITSRGVRPRHRLASGTGARWTASRRGPGAALTAGRR